MANIMNQATVADAIAARQHKDYDFNGEVNVSNTSEEKAVYTPEEIKSILSMSRAKTYSYLAEVAEKQKPFRVIKIGRLVRIPKIDFDKWLAGTQEEAG